MIDAKRDKLSSPSSSWVSENGGSPPSASQTELSSALCQTLATGLVVVTETHEKSLEDNESTREYETIDQRTLGAVGPDLGENRNKIPVDSK